VFIAASLSALGRSRFIAPQLGEFPGGKLHLKIYKGTDGTYLGIADSLKEKVGGRPVCPRVPERKTTMDHSTKMRSPVTLPATSNWKVPEGSKKSKVKEPLWVLPRFPRVSVSLRWMVPRKFPFVSYDHTR
jgi:hypothetical protein